MPAKKNTLIIMDEEIEVKVEEEHFYEVNKDGVIEEIDNS